MQYPAGERFIMQGIITNVKLENQSNFFSVFTVIAQSFSALKSQSSHQSLSYLQISQIRDHTRNASLHIIEFQFCCNW